MNHSITISGSPRLTLPITAALPYLGCWIERPIAFRHAGIFSELYEITGYDREHHTGLARYVGLRRPCFLMSETEKRLSPMRFPQ